MKLSTTLIHLNSIPNPINASLVKQFYEYLKEIVTMTDKLKLDLSNMVEEHRQIVKELDNLIEVANKENKMEIVLFAEKLKLHAKNEEEVLYPAAILVGEYLKLQN
ncbi:MAG: hemerythrin domain-containing protein [Nitrososphaeraceae archaeon]